MDESDLQKKIRDNLEERVGGFWVKVHGGPYQLVGLPDLIGLIKGNFIGIEVKCPGRENKVTDRQERIMEKIRENGGVAFMAISVEMAIDKLEESKFSV